MTGIWYGPKKVSISSQTNHTRHNRFTRTPNHNQRGTRTWLDGTLYSNRQLPGRSWPEVQPNLSQVKHIKPWSVILPPTLHKYFHIKAQIFSYQSSPLNLSTAAPGPIDDFLLPASESSIFLWSILSPSPVGQNVLIDQDLFILQV